MSAQIRDITELTPLAQRACRLFMAKCAEAGLDIFITETYRSQARQNELYEQGRTRLWDEKGNPLKIVTWTKNSRHTSRRAWDIACKGKTLYDTKVLREAGQIGKSLGITWGGDWETPDMPHFEIGTDWKEPKEEEEMAEVRYNTIEEVPEWGRATIQSMINDGCFANPKALDLSYDMVRIFVVWERRKK